MADVTIKIPEDIKEIISETSETIYVEALKDIARKRITYTQKRLNELKKRIAAYETKYGKSYEDFSQKVPDTRKAHDDWIEWSYLVKVADQLTSKIDKLKLLMGK